MHRSFKYILLYVTDLERSVAFYRDRLDFTFVEYHGPTVALMMFGDAPLILHYLEDKDFHAVKNKGQGVLIGYHLDNVDDFFDLLKARGAPVKDPPKDEPWGDRDFFLHDPDGYEVWFSQTWMP